EVVVTFADEGRDTVQTRDLRGTESALAGQQAISVGRPPDDDRLEQTSRLDRCGEVSQRGFREMLARLVGIRHHGRERHHGENRSLATTERPGERERADLASLNLLLAVGFRNAPPHAPPPRHTLVPTSTSSSSPRR